MKTDTLSVRIRKLTPDAAIPHYATSLAAGVDLTACLDKPVLLRPLGRALIPTGLAIELPPGYEAQIRPRSGLAIKHGITMLNSPGTIDADYRGEICVIVINLGESDFEIHNGDRIAQMVIAPVTSVCFIETMDLSETERGSGGFGSTGRK